MTNAVAIWIWLCVYLNCAGWFLSAIRQLNAAGYAAVLVIGVAALWAWKIRENQERRSEKKLFSSGTFHKWLRRFRKPFPLAFLVLSAMIFAGGAIHAPNNHDALAYRLPRVLHWLAADQWLWIHTLYSRVNNRACGMEWLSAPLLALFRSDRLLFLINLISFFLLPGLLFSLLTRLGVRRRVAWQWMWIFPTGYCFALQAGSISNDSFAAPYALAAIDFALRAKISKRPRDFFSSVLAAALLTAAKTGNLPLLLPWAIAIFPSLKFFVRRPVATAVICIIAIFASFVPTAFLNERYCHDWSGLSAEGIEAHGNPVIRTAANMILVVTLNLTPPVFPEADQWNRLMQNTIPPDLHLKLQQTLSEPAAIGLQVQEMQIEECAGLGFGVTIFLVVSVFIAAKGGGKLFSKTQFRSPEILWRTAIILSPWIAAFALITQSEVYPIGRILAPYYVLMLPLLLVFPGHEQLVKKFAWRTAAFLVFAMAAGLLIICPARPLFPAETILGAIHARHPDSRPLARAEEVFLVYRNRSSAFEPAVNILPPGLKVLGFVTYDDPETSLWKPLGSRQIIHVCPDDSPAYLKSQGVEYILAKDELFGGKNYPAFGDWLKQMNAQVVQKIQLNLRAAVGTTDWYLVKLN
jgi:hypothetical protein